MTTRYIACMTTQPIITSDSDLGTELGLAIKTLMWRRGVSGQQVADALGIGRSTVSGKLKGRVSITVQDLYTIARLLDAEPGDLLPRLDSNQQPSGYWLSQVSDVHGVLVDLASWRRERALACLPLTVDRIPCGEPAPVPPAPRPAPDRHLKAAS